MFTIHIMEILSIDKNTRREVYNYVKDAIPDCLRQDYEYTEEGPFRLPLMPDTTEYSFVKEITKNKHFHLEIREKTVYSPKEEENCEFFYMWLSEPMEIAAVSLKDYGTKFYDGCTVCEADKSLISNALIDRKLVKNKQIIQLSDSIIAISKTTKKLIEEQGLTGFEFKYTLNDYKAREMGDYFCVAPTAFNILPPMHTQTWLWEWREKACEHKQYLIASNVKYSRSDLIKAKDLNFTFEFSYGLNPNRFLIVSKKLRDLFIKNKIRAGFMPVLMV